MNRALRILTVCAVCTAAACGGSDDTVTILTFQAATDAIESGQSTKLFFTVEPADAKVVIGTLGDLTGQSSVSVAPTMTTSYQLTATKGSAVANKTLTVTVGATTAAAIKVDPVSTTPTAGDHLGVTLTVLASNGKPAPGFRGTVRMASTDPKAMLPDPFTFTANDMGVKQVMVTLVTAGVSTMTATDTSSKTGVQGAASVTVQPAAAATFQLTTLPASAVAGQALVLSITAHDQFNNVATTFGGKAVLTSGEATDILPPATSFTAGVATVSLAFTKVGNHIATVTDQAAALPPVNTSSVAIGPAAPFRIALAPANQTTTAGTAESFTASVFDAFNNASTNYAGTLHFAAIGDPIADVPADFTFSAGDAGTHSFSATLKTAGSVSVRISDPATSGISGALSWTVGPAAAASFQLTALPANAVAGQSLVMSIAARDPFNNLATTFSGRAKLTSGDPSDVLPPTTPLIGGVATVSLEFTRAGDHVATVTDEAATIPATNTTTVAVRPAAPSRVAISPTNQTTTAGTAESFSATLVDFFNNTATNYAGTLHFTAIGDPNAVVPADFTFSAGDAGAHTFSATLKTAGSVSVAVSDTVASGLSGTVTWNVGPAAAATCVASQAPASATAGTVVGLTVALRDTFGNAAKGYAGTVHVTATDARANLPGDVTYTAGDAGSHAFSVSLLTTGDQTVTATDTANAGITCGLRITINPAAPKVTLALASDVNSGYPAPVAVRMNDLFDNALPAYAGTVSFASSDTGAGASTPANIVFTGGEGGVATTSATFVTVGTQTLTATASGGQGPSSAAAKVHGLVYTPPDTGRIRLVANAARSSAQVIQLDLVANERLERSSLFTIRITTSPTTSNTVLASPGSFAMGMNLPLDTTRITGDTTLLTAGDALVYANPSTTPTTPTAPFSVARLGSDHVLYTAVSMKRAANLPMLTQAIEVQANQVFYSVRLKLTPGGTTGTVFDGAQPLATYRASVRDQFGDDFIQQSDIGIGKLEIR
ncbi:MAG: hypothetical protein E6J91_41190 [Deltaproteobacteria bacterium]|nr:MAG: hypothetical protein E6J91_41190 [Deltaproteobacteria bacterium]